MLAIQAAYEPFPAMPDTHFEAAFGHLTGYSAIYCTYLWSLVIAKDLCSTFDRSRRLAPGVGKRYRDLVLAPGGSMPAADIVRRYLGRPRSTSTPGAAGSTRNRHRPAPRPEG